NVLVDSVTLMRLKERNKAAGPFARARLNVVFNSEELESKSLTGRKSNAFKDALAKEALDPIRLNAVIGKIFYFFTFICIH
ncbi:MAG: BEN domain-containing protein, partial [Rickettsia endosymbiont of Ixodes persulcatus]|nr:BEN domain-containing protein [Rickettsia endosymbiont of Ixodes persulcatus]